MIFHNLLNLFAGTLNSRILTKGKEAQKLKGLGVLQTASHHIILSREVAMADTTCLNLDQDLAFLW